MKHSQLFLFNNVALKGYAIHLCLLVGFGCFSGSCWGQNIEWQKCFGGDSSDVAHSIQQTSDGGYIVAGHSYSFNGDATGNHGGSDYWIVKLDANGNLSWQKSLGGSDKDKTYSVEQTTDGGYIVAGDSWSNDGDITGNHGSYDYWIIKLDSIGNFSWQKCFGGSGADVAYSIQQTTDGGYIVAGGSESIDGDVQGNHGNLDYWIVKLGNDGVGIEEASMVGGLSVSPNPVVGNSITVGYHLSGATEVEMSIMDVLGNCVLCEEGVFESEGEHRRVIAVGGLASGVYFVELRSEYGRGSSQFIKH